MSGYAALVAKLNTSGWTEVIPQVEYTKNHWQIVFDTSSWIELYSNNERVTPDVPVPLDDYTVVWTANLITHLLTTYDALTVCKRVDRSGS